MAKKNLTPEDSDLFRQTIGKVHAVKSDKVLLTESDKPKPYPKVQAANVEEHLSATAEFDIEKLRALAQDDRVVAIGEVGLDYFRLTQPDEEKKLQKDGLVKIINLAQELQKPLMIHCRPSKGSQDAYHDLFDQFLISNFQFPIILHFFTGNLETVNRFLKLGAYFTFGGVITFARDYDEVIRAIPLENIFLETDAPYVTPEPYRGKQNEPAYVVEVAEKMAELKNITVEKLAMIQGENFEKVFRRKF